MQFHLERGIALNKDPEFKNLYKWALVELDESGKAVGRDWIPWDWSVTFMVSQVTLSDRLAIDRILTDGESQVKTQIGASIGAKLLPGSPHERGLDDKPSYSMFGTSRPLRQFHLNIEPIEDDRQDYCSAWGNISYTIDIDFRDETTDDAIIFNLYVRPETFEKYVQAIRSGQVDRAILHLRQVPGFYAEWTPGISAEHIKVLTSYPDDQPIGETEGSAITPPRLGPVSEVSFVMYRTVDLDTASSPVDLEPEDADEPTEEMQPVSLKEPEHIGSVRSVALLASLRTAAWTIAGLLLVSLILK